MGPSIGIKAKSTYIDLTVLWKRSWFSLKMLKLINDILFPDLPYFMVLTLLIRKSFCKSSSKTVIIIFGRSSSKEISSPLWKHMVKTFQCEDHNSLNKKLTKLPKVIERWTFYFVVWISMNLTTSLHVKQWRKFKTPCGPHIKEQVKFLTPKSTYTFLNMSYSKWCQENPSRMCIFDLPK